MSNLNLKIDQIHDLYFKMRDYHKFNGSIDLSHNNLDDESIIWICKLIIENKHINGLKLNSNNLKYRSGMLLSKAFIQNGNILSFHGNNNNFEKYGIQYLLESCMHTKMNTIDLGNIYSVSLDKICQILPKCKHLKNLYMTICEKGGFNDNEYNNLRNALNNINLWSLKLDTDLDKMVTNKYEDSLFNFNIWSYD